LFSNDFNGFYQTFGIVEVYGDYGEFGCIGKLKIKCGFGQEGF